MGELIDLAEARARRARRLASRPGRPIAELEALIARLTPLVRARAPKQRRALQTELLAATGAISAGLYDEAKSRLERLAERLERADGAAPGPRDR